MVVYCLFLTSNQFNQLIGNIGTELSKSLLNLLWQRHFISKFEHQFYILILIHYRLAHQNLYSRYTLEYRKDQMTVIGYQSAVSDCFFNNGTDYKASCRGAFEDYMACLNVFKAKYGTV